MAHFVKFTPKLREKILEALSKGCTMVEACETAGISARAIYIHMKQEPAFRAEVEQANEIGVETHLVPIAKQRATKGWQEEVFYEGKQCGTRTMIDNNLLWKLIQAKNATYRPQIKDIGDALITISEAMQKAEDRVKER